MKNYDARQIRQGQQIRNEMRENPGTFTSDGASFGAPDDNLDRHNAIRKAGPGGAFAMALWSNPDLAKRVKGWSNAFAQTPAGQQFFGLNQEQPDA